MNKKLLVFFIVICMSFARSASCDEIDRSMTIVVTSKKSFSPSRSWQLSINSGGSACLMIDNFDSAKLQRFELENLAFQRVREVILKERFFDLCEPEYGDEVLDGGSESITVVQGNNVKTVAVFSVGNIRGSRLANCEEVLRLARILILLRGTFVSDEAIDLRPYYKKLIDRAEEWQRKQKETKVASEKLSSEPE